MHQQQVNLENAALPGLWRRLAAIVYDSILVMALVAAAFTVVYLPLAIGLDMKNLEDYPLIQSLMTVWMGIVAIGFHLWFWTHGGQTLGMRAWRLKLYTKDGRRPTLSQAITRYLAAILSAAAFGMGFLWILIDTKKRAWHDLASSTRLVLVDPNKT